MERGAGGWRNFAYVIIPGALPFIIVGLALVVVLVAAELAGAAFGIGYLIQMSQQVIRVDQMFVGLIVLGAIGFTADLRTQRASPASLVRCREGQPEGRISRAGPVGPALTQLESNLLRAATARASVKAVVARMRGERATNQSRIPRHWP
ncbi:MULTISPECIES: hypothetical protein [unclassified Bradyrhizobium]